MRDVAFAGNAPSASATNAIAPQISVAFRMPGIQPLPLNFRGPRDTPMTRRPRLTMRTPCHARWRNQSIDFVRNFASHPQLRVHADASETAVCGRNCRAVYASLTILTRWLRQSFLAGTWTAMRIYGPNGTTLGTPAGNARRTSSTGFSLPDAATAPDMRSAAPPKSAGNIDALLALQGVDEDPV